MLALFLATGVGLFTSRWIAAPILRISAAAGAIAGGDLAQSVPAFEIREIRALGSCEDGP
ncbi:HAMP domain-containing protein [Sorangium sp. So ce1128]